MSLFKTLNYYKRDEVDFNAVMEAAQQNHEDVEFLSNFMYPKENTDAARMEGGHLSTSHIYMKHKEICNLAESTYQSTIN
eukprot:15325056-Ditylum_brightwellii.AAC.1